MISYRENLAKIGIPPGVPVSYKGFVSRPSSLRQAIQSMNAPQNWQLATETFVNESWSDAVQGVAWDGQNWILSGNAHQNKPFSKDKSIYVFKEGQGLTDDKVFSRFVYTDVPHPIASDEEDNHYGQLCYYNGRVYVSHFWVHGPLEGRRNVIVFKVEGGHLQFERWIELGLVTTSTGEKRYAEFQAINPWDGKMYTGFGSEITHEFFLHDLNTGAWTGETFRFRGDLPSNVQGACFSPNGHLYVSVDNRNRDWGIDNKWIMYYSALNGQFLGKIPVLAEEDNQELEGLCHANVSLGDGRTVQIHIILLENCIPSVTDNFDNIYFKSFSADIPDAV